MINNFINQIEKWNVIIATKNNLKRDAKKSTFIASLPSIHQVNKLALQNIIKLNKIKKLNFGKSLELINSKMEMIKAVRAT